MGEEKMGNGIEEVIAQLGAADQFICLAADQFICLSARWNSDKRQPMYFASGKATEEILVGMLAEVGRREEMFARSMKAALVLLEG